MIEANRKALAEEVKELRKTLLHSEEAHADNNRHLQDLNTSEVVKVLKQDPIVKAIIEGDVQREIEDVEITGRDLISVNLVKLETWWGISDPD